MEAAAALALKAIAEVAAAADLIHRDLELCGSQRRQQRRIAGIRANLETLNFLIGYEVVEREQKAAA